MKTFALILADGQASRMGGEDKGLALLGGKALIDHVIDRVRPQVSHIAISTNRNLEEYARRSPHIFPDARQWQHFGPLSALCTAANDLQLATADWLSTGVERKGQAIPGGFCPNRRHNAV